MTTSIESFLDKHEGLLDTIAVEWLFAQPDMETAWKNCENPAHMIDILDGAWSEEQWMWRVEMKLKGHLYLLPLPDNSLLMEKVYGRYNRDYLKTIRWASTASSKDVANAVLRERREKRERETIAISTAWSIANMENLPEEQHLRAIWTLTTSITEPSNYMMIKGIVWYINLMLPEHRGQAYAWLCNKIRQLFPNPFMEE